MKHFKFLFFVFLFFSFINEVRGTDIPRMYIYGNISNMNEKSDERRIEVIYYNNDFQFSSYAKLKIQGASSLKYEKKNYNITFYEDEEFSIKKNVDFKWGELNKYTLKANWIDKTHARNIVSAKIYREIQSQYGLFTDTINNGVVDGFPIEIYENDRFLGLYTLNLHKENFFVFELDNSNHLLVGSKASNMITNFKMEENDSFKSFEIEVGKEDKNSLEKINRLINFVNNSTDDEFKKDFSNYFNFDAALNYYCFMLFAELVDNADNNLFLVTYDGEVWFPSMYDLDISFGTSKFGSKLDYKDEMSVARKGSRLWKKFERNFADYIVVRYYELREKILTKENIISEFENFNNLIPLGTFEKEETKWKNIPGFNINQIEEFLDVRIPFVDSEIEKLKTDNYEEVYEKFSMDENSKSIKDKNVKYVIFSLLLVIVSFIVYKIRK